MPELHNWLAILLVSLSIAIFILSFGFPLIKLQVCLEVSTNNLINGLGHSLNVLLVQPRNIDSTARWEVDVVAIDQRFALGRREVKVSMARQNLANCWSRLLLTRRARFP